MNTNLISLFAKANTSLVCLFAKANRTLIAAIALALSSSALALSNSFSYQGSLTDAGTPANGSYDLQFQLQTSAGANVGAALVREDVSVASGVFSVELDFGAAITSADFRLQIGVRPGSSVGAFTTLAPTTPIRPTPQAQVAGIASEAVTVSPNSITSASIQDNAIAAIDIEDSTIGNVDVDTNEIQLRVSGTCFSGTAIRTIAPNGTVTCENVGGSGGTVTSVATGAGLTGGPISTSGTIAIATGGVTGSMVADGTVANVDLAANAVNSGSVADGSIGSADINTVQVQARVSGTCAVGSSINAIAANGTVTCETDDIGAPGWSLTGNAGTNPSTQFIGTTDAQPMVLRTNGQPSLTIMPTSVGANIVAGNPGNVAQNTSLGATIAGGGAFGFVNRVTDNYGTIGGGRENRVGNDDAAPNNAVYATVSGGEGNTAHGRFSSVAGGERNNASGQSSAIIGGSVNAATGAAATVIGGVSNCAGGDGSVAGGNFARIRIGLANTAAPCQTTASSGDADGDEGTFMWADDSTTSEFVSTGPNQFLVRADGGVMLNTNARVLNGDDLVVGARRLSGDSDSDLRLLTRNNRSINFIARDDTGGLTIVMSNLIPGTDRMLVAGGSGGNATLSNGGTWTNASSRSYKTGFAAVNTLDVLARVVDLPISTWNYIDSAEGLHMGPIAEDFKASFGLAGDGKSIATVDADGVALAAIQGLNQKLEAENAGLRKRLAALEAHLGLSSE